MEESTRLQRLQLSASKRRKVAAPRGTAFLVGQLLHRCRITTPFPPPLPKFGLGSSAQRLLGNPPSARVPAATPCPHLDVLLPLGLPPQLQHKVGQVGRPVGHGLAQRCQQRHQAAVVAAAGTKGGNSRCAGGRGGC